MHLVDKENDFPAGLGYFLQDRLQPLLELAPILGPGHQRAHIQCYEPLVFQALRHIPVDDSKCQSFHDGGFSHPGLSDQDGIVFRAAGKDLDHPADFVIPANHRVEFSFAAKLRKIPTVFFQGLIFFLRIRISDPLGAANIHQRAEDLVLGGAQFP